jgi:hypothetical protein
MAELKHPLLTRFYTYVEHEDETKFNAPHHFVVKKVSDDKVIGRVDFQEGPIKECGVNGVGNEDVLVMVLSHLQGFQNSQYACVENAEAINYIEAALHSLRSRTNNRIERGVLGTHTV